jgi:ribosome-associated toxin RatA of RatAB toxin-antitoxin module
MKHVKKSVLLWYSAHEMYELVTDVPAYPQFLPWCDRAEVIEKTDDGVMARLGLKFAGLHHSFTTRNVQVPDRSVNLSLVDGPFSVLDGAWSFNPIDAAGSAPTKACRIDFDMRYTFSSNALELVVSPVFDRIANTLVDSFVKRAERVYGPR